METRTEYRYVSPDSFGEHDYQLVNVAAATCTTEGYTGDTVCSVCGKVKEAGTVIPATGHDYVLTASVSATCTEQGYTEYACTKCGHSYRDGYTNALGHDYVVSSEPANCITVQRDVYTCSRCSDSYEVLGEVIWTDWSASPAPEGTDASMIETRTTYRYRDYGTMTSSEANLPGYDLVSTSWQQSGTGSVRYAAFPSGFDTANSLYGTYNRSAISSSESSTEKTEAGGSTVEGYIYWHWCRNGNYGEAFMNRFISPSYDGEYNTFHAFYSTEAPSVDVDTSDATYPYCNKINTGVCSDSQWFYYVPVYRQDYTTYSKLYTYGSYGEWSDWSETAVEATSTRQVETRTEYRYVSPDSFGDHNYQRINAVSATCTTEGYTGDTVCSFCGKVKETGTTVPALGHDWQEATSGENYLAPTCTEEGLAYMVCTRCSEVGEGRVLPATGHTWDAGEVTAPTCTEEGYTTVHCTTCGAEDMINITDALGHDLVVDEAVAATCTQTGLTEGSHCSRCDYKVAQDVLPALGHDWQEATSGENYLAPTCTEEGLAYMVCTRCSEVGEGRVLPATGHTWDAGEVTAPTCTEEGYTTVHCTTCGAEDMINITDALGHDLVVDEAVAATCTQTGLTEGSHCSRCDYKVAQTVIPALGHKDYQYTDNGDGTHKVTCGVCTAVIEAAEAHVYVEGVCLCGATESTEPTLDTGISVGQQLFLESDLTINFRVKTSQLTNYDLSTAYLVVEKDQYPAGLDMYVKTTTLTEGSVVDGRLVFVYNGIAACEMNDEIRVTLHIKDASGKEFISPTLTTSITSYAKLLLNTYKETNTKLCTLLMDMLNYGTAAQIYFNRHADAPANTAYDEFAAYTKYASTDLREALADLSSVTALEGATATLTQALDLASRIGVQYKVTLTNAADAANAAVVVRDAEGNVLDTLPLADATQDSRGRYVVTFYGNTSRQMRRVVYATVEVNGVAISGTYGYSASTYAYLVNTTAGMPELLAKAVKAMIIYGDSADVYFAQ